MQTAGSRLRLKYDGTRADTRFRLSAKGRVHLNRRGRQFSPLLAAEVCASAVLMLDTPCSEVLRRVYWLPTPFASFPFTSPIPPVSPCAFTFQLGSSICIVWLVSNSRRWLSSCLRSISYISGLASVWKDDDVTRVLSAFLSTLS